MSVADKSRNEGRRRLIKSAAAAPVVFTLPSGAALAAVSVTCHDKAKDRALPAAVVSTPGDGWVRARLQAWTFREKNGSSDLSGFMLNGSYYRVLNGKAVPVAHVKMNGSKQPRIDEGTYYYVLVNYPEGSPVLDSADSSATPMAGASCWNSLNPGDSIPADNIIIS